MRTGKGTSRYLDVIGLSKEFGGLPVLEKFKILRGPEGNHGDRGSPPAAENQPC